MSKNDLYAGKADGRQGGAEVKPSRFRPRYRQLTEDEKAFHDALKSKAAELEEMIEQIAPGRYRAMALTDLESSIMWAVKELTGEGGLQDQAGDSVSGD